MTAKEEETLNAWLDEHLESGTHWSNRVAQYADHASLFQRRWISTTGPGLQTVKPTHGKGQDTIPSSRSCRQVKGSTLLHKST